MKSYNFFLLGLFILIIFSCTNSDHRVGRLLLDSFPNRNGFYSHFVVIPGAGCDSCISGAEYFVMKNYTRESILFIFTDIESVKILKNKLGKEIFSAKNVILDVENKFGYVGEDENSFYPVIFTLDKNKLKDVRYVSPKDIMTLPDLQTMLKKIPHFTIDLEKYIKTKKYDSTVLSDYGDVIEYVPLVTPLNLPISVMISLKITEEYIFYLDIEKRLFQFNSKGDFIRLIGAIGGGPEEYLSVTDFEIDTNMRTISLYDLQRNKILVYEIDNGTFVKNLDLPEDVLNVKTFYNDFIGYTQAYSSDDKNKFIIFSKEGIIQDSLVFKNKANDITYDILKLANMAYENDRFLYILPFDDMTYFLDENKEIEAYYKVEMGGYKLPPEVGSNVELYNKHLTDYIFELNMKKNQGYVFMDFFFDMENYRLIYDINQKVFKQVSKGRERDGINNDLDDGWSFWPMIMDGSKMIDIKYIDSTFDISQEIVNQETRNLYKNLIKSDNPILQIVHLR